MKNDFIDTLTYGIVYVRTRDLWVRNIVDKEYEKHKKNSDIQALKSYLDMVVFSNWTIKNVIFNDPATIVFWEDGTKTVVKAQNEPFDKEKGLAMAIVKKLYGNTGKYFDEIKRWVSDEEADRSAPTAIPLSKIIVDGANAFKNALKSKGLCINKPGANNDTAEKTSDRSDQKTEER